MDISYLKNSCQNMFGLSFPPDSVELKREYRRLAKEKHPDAGGSNEEFIKLRETYELLLSFSLVGDTAKNAQILRTTDGTPLFDLGKGLGPLINGDTCSECSGKGYTERKIEKLDETKSVICDCRKIKCWKCKDGKFTLRNGGIVDCLNCKGTGIFISPFPLGFCFICLGGGFIFAKLVAEILYIKCLRCKGAGEEKLFNPVLQKGAMGVR